MDKQEALHYIGAVDWKTSRLGLERIQSLLSALGNPQESLRFVHVAGTNGKGSVCSMLASVLAKAGYQTGLYTSPFVNSFNERIRVNGAEIEDTELAALTETVRKHADALQDHPTEFELVTALGLLYFQKKKCDVVVLEVGLGGRLDATNVIPVPLLAIITSIGLDHTAELGQELSKIAREKAGIVKPGTVLVSAPQTPKVAEVLQDVCKSCAATLCFAQTSRVEALSCNIHGQSFLWEEQQYQIPLLGKHQLENVAVVLTAIERLRERGFGISKDAVSAGLAAVQWPARLELLSEHPVVLLDGGHNPQGAKVLAESLHGLYPQRKWVFVVGVMGDKDWSGMLEAVVPLAERVYCIAANSTRALPAEILAKGIAAQWPQLPCEACQSPEKALQKALASAGKTGLICAFGSLYTAGEVRALFPSRKAIKHREENL